MSAILLSGCDAGLAGRPKDGTACSPRLALATSILASSLAFVDGSVVNVGLPAIGRSLGADAEALQWVVNAYLLPLTALLLLAGSLGDRYGRGRTLVLGVALFGGASAVCAAAPALPWLLAARVVQGAGAALVLPNSLAILGAAYQGPARARAVGTWAAASAVSGALGPVLGGWLIDVSGWRMIFLINLPPAAGAIALALVGVRDGRSGPAAPPLDVSGAACGATALAALAFALTLGSGPSGWTPAAVGAGLGGLAMAVAFVAVEVKKGDRAMTPPALFGSRRVIALNLMTFGLYGALGGLLVLLPYVLITAAGYRATAAGAALLPFPLVMAAGGPVTGALTARFGPRPLLVGGSLLAGAGLALAARIDAPGGYVGEVLPCVLLLAVGMSCAAAPLTTAVLSAVDARHTGAASGLNSAVARAGGLTATALLGAVLSARGAALVQAFHAAALVGAAASAASAVAAWLAFSGAARSRPGSAGRRSRPGRPAPG